MKERDSEAHQSYNYANSRVGALKSTFLEWRHGGQELVGALRWMCTEEIANGSVLAKKMVEHC